LSPDWDVRFTPGPDCFEGSGGENVGMKAE